MSGVKTGSWGGTFVHPLFDYAIIGGGLSIPIALALWWGGAALQASWLPVIAYLAVFLNAAHFAASSIRLYSKKGAAENNPWLAYAFPLLFILVVTVSIALSKYLGRHLIALYLTWSPYHYAAQTFGLCLIYLYRSGQTVSPQERKWLKLFCLAPFLWAFLAGRRYGAGLGWFVTIPQWDALPTLEAITSVIETILVVVSLAGPIVCVWWGKRRWGSRGPWIVPLLVFSNGLWWIGLQYINAFVWVTSFHALQYLGIVVLFHVRERVDWRVAKPRAIWEGFKFYGISVGLGYLLFRCWPYFYESVGFGYSESVLMIIAVINIHHFVVDAYIWRLRNDRNWDTLMPVEGNREISGSSAAA